MMTLLAFVGALATICCPLTFPFWAFILFGYHTGVRKEIRRIVVRASASHRASNEACSSPGRRRQ